MESANPYQAPPSPGPPAWPAVAKLKDPRLLAWWAIGLLVAGSAMNWLDYGLRLVLPGEQLTAEDSFAFTALSLVRIGTAVCGLAAGIVHLCWTYRAARNAGLINPTLMQISPGLAVGSYFIPFVNLYLPAKAMRGIAIASSGSASGVAWWWAMYLISSFLAIPAAMADEGTFFTRPSDFEHPAIATDVVFVLLAVSLVWRITRAQFALVRDQP